MACPSNAQVGLSYLAGENPAIFTSNLTLEVLPLRKSSLENNVFLRKEFWPTVWEVASVGTEEVALEVNAVEVVARFKISLRLLD